MLRNLLSSTKNKKSRMTLLKQQYTLKKRVMKVVMEVLKSNGINVSCGEKLKDLKSKCPLKPVSQISTLCIFGL